MSGRFLILMGLLGVLAFGLGLGWFIAENKHGLPVSQWSLLLCAVGSLTLLCSSHFLGVRK